MLNNRSGIILLVILWILVILSLLAIGLGRRTSIESDLTKHTLGKLKSKYLAMGAVVYAMDKIKNDSDQMDTKFRCGFVLEENKEPEDLFRDAAIGKEKGSFDIFYYDDSQTSHDLRYGFEDEESKININAQTPNNYKILVNLMTQLGYDDSVAETVASSIVDWRDENNDVFNESYGAEDDYYTGQQHNNSYHCKNGPFDSLEELLLVRGMTPEIFSKIRGMITIFPQQGNFLLNFDTASKSVLLAFARSLVGPQTNTTPDDADGLVEKAVLHRLGDDQIWGTKDDEPVELNGLALNQRETVLFLLMTQSQTKVSKYLRMHIRAMDADFHVPSNIEVVIKRDDLSLVYWHRN